MNQDILFVIALILLGIRLPSFMNRQGMSRSGKLVFVILAFLILCIVWFIWQIINTYI